MKSEEVEDIVEDIIKTSYLKIADKYSFTESYRISRLFALSATDSFMRQVIVNLPEAGVPKDEILLDLKTFLNEIIEVCEDIIEGFEND